MNKLCKKCGRDLPATAEYWYPRHTRPGNWQSCCKSCSHLKTRQPLGIRFWLNVATGPQDGCWNWLKSKNKNGYGIVWDGDKATLAHRLAWRLSIGPIEPIELHVCHSCDNRLCCNPNHLWLGTSDDNMKDMANKHRGSSARRTLTNEQIREIRAMLNNGASRQEVGKAFGVFASAIRQIAIGKTYRNVL
jgi:HNH endonuclease